MIRRLLLIVALLSAPARADVPVNIVLDGDSISAGWGSTPGHGLDGLIEAELGGAVRVRNVAVGGRPVGTCLDLYPSLVAPLLAPRPAKNLIVFHAGDNDIRLGRDAAATYAAFTSYVAAAHAQGWKVLVSTEFPRFDFDPQRAAQLLAYNVLLLGNRAGADAVVDAGANSHFADPMQRHDPAIFSQDGIHPSDGGYAILAAMVMPSIKRMIGD